MKERLRKIFMGVLVMCLTLTLVYVPMQVKADGDTASMELNGATTIEGGVFQATGGKAEISIAGIKKTGTEREFRNIGLNDEIKIVLTAEDGKKGVLRTPGDSGLILPAPTTSGQITTYTFTLAEIRVAANGSAALNFEFEDNNPGAGDPPPGEGDPLPGEEAKSVWSLDLRIGSTEYRDIKGNSSCKISSMEDIKEITVLRQRKNDEASVEVEDEIRRKTDNSSKSMSTTCLDDQGRGVLEVYTISEGTNYVTLNLTSHYGDLGVDVDLKDFYVTNITFYVEDFKGMVVTSDTPEPDMFDSLVHSDIVDLKTTTAAKPAEIDKYYGTNTISINDYAGTAVTTVALGEGINPGAVTISGRQVTFNSAYYASVPLVITLEDGNTGYVTINRLGGEIRDYNANATKTLHGTQDGYTLTGTPYEGKYNIVANFYYNPAKSYRDYNVVATLTYGDGRTEVKTVEGVYESECTNHVAKGGDYIVYSGDKDSAPVKVSVTVVKAGTSDTTFAGASFGAGKGVEFSRDTAR